MKIRFLLASSVVISIAFAQEAGTKPSPQGSQAQGQVVHSGESVMVFRAQTAGGPDHAGGDVMFFGAETAGFPKLVKGAPYSAQTVSEHTQTLADGNTIDRKQTGAVYRDSEGRTRREQSLGPLGPIQAGATPIQLVFINDPVAGVSYVLNVRKKTAQKVPLPGMPGGPQAGAVAGPNVSISTGSGGAMVAAGGAEGPVVYSMAKEQPVHESLGTKMIEGVQAEGTRITATIPAGQIGNERPIETVTETWYSPQLQATVLSTTTDPLIGRTVYQLTNISLGEPDPSLFEVPPDYTLTEGPAKRELLWVTKPAK
jgi:hypothetical protein